MPSVMVDAFPPDERVFQCEDGYLMERMYDTGMNEPRKKGIRTTAHTVGRLLRSEWTSIVHSELCCWREATLRRTWHLCSDLALAVHNI